MTVEKDPPKQEELALDPAEVAEHGDPDFEANDPGDLNHDESQEKPEGDEIVDPVKAEDEPEPVKAEGDVEDPEKELTPEELKAEAAQLRKTTKALTQRLGIISKEKQALSTKLQESIKAVPAADADPADGDEPQRADFKTKAEFDVAVQAETDRRIALQDFNSKCNAVETAGSKAFGDKWAKAKADLAVLDDQGRIPMDLLSVALETDDPAKVLFKLGNDLELATELMGMTPIKRAIAMDKIATAKPVERAQSKTPPPIDPLGGKGATNDAPTDKDSDEEWNRKEAIRERRAAEAKRKLRGY